jgi:hypothetical protein
MVVRGVLLKIIPLMRLETRDHLEIKILRSHYVCLFKFSTKYEYRYDVSLFSTYIHLSVWFTSYLPVLNPD